MSNITDLTKKVIVAVRSSDTGNWERFYEVQGTHLSSTSVCQIAFRWHFKRKENDKENELTRMTMALIVMPITTEQSEVMLSHIIR